MPTEDGEAAGPTRPRPAADRRAEATIRVTRDTARTKDRKRAYAVMVDWTQVGELRRGETRDFAVSPGTRAVRVSVEFEHSVEWDVALAAGDEVSLVCRSRGKRSDGNLDLYLADPDDERARRRHDDPDRDLPNRQRVVTRDGRVLFVWAHPSGYLRSLDPGQGGSDGDSFVVELAYWVLVLPVLALVRWVRHRLLFKGGWSVGVVRKRRFLWPKKVRLERLGSEAGARARAAEVIAELEDGPGA